MTVISSSLSSIFSLFGSAFQLSALFPAIIFALANYLVILPHFDGYHFVARLRALDDNWQTVLILGLVGILGYTLTALNVPLIRFFEGYPFQNSIIGKLLRRVQQHQHDSVENRLKTLQAEHNRLSARYERLEQHGATSPRLELLQQRLARLNVHIRDAKFALEYYYPHKENLLPTGLGNTIAAFEAYSGNRYKMESVIFWPRLAPILDKEQYAIYIERQKVPFDFLLNLTTLTGVFALEYTYAQLYFVGRLPWPELIGLGLLMYGLYRVASTAAFYWGGTVMVAFDLYRKLLWEKLGLRTPEDFYQEQKTWHELSAFLTYRDEIATWSDYYQPIPSAPSLTNSDSP